MGQAHDAARGQAGEDGEDAKVKNRRHLSQCARRTMRALDKAAAFNAHRLNCLRSPGYSPRTRERISLHRGPVANKARHAAWVAGDSNDTAAATDPGPAANPGPAADSGPAADPGPAADTGPATDPGPAADTGPAADPGSATDSGPAADTRPATTSADGPEL
ncbi:hypothetical protein JKP88DRAFT_328694 [Tribonema minus]|uniref:Uncharacterized protein n=1 Tax=Tribonema minus TaxID=303371 RepID=A0A836CAL2_9STRA|nr:hypothetical protein JKP88DRAFT_328694 [Tribonema minus]